MLKINYYRLCFFTFLFLNNLNIRLFSSTDLNNNLTTESQQSSPPSQYHYPESLVSPHPLFPLTNCITPEPYNWHFNGSSHTFIPPFMCSGWDPNNSTHAFDINNFSMSIPYESENLNDSFADMNNNSPLLTPDDLIQNDTTDTSPSTNSNTISSVLLDTQQQEFANETNDPIATVQLRQGSSHSMYHEPSYTNTNNVSLVIEDGSKGFNTDSSDSSENPYVKKNFICPTCKRVFNRKGSLTNHRKIHNREKKKVKKNKRDKKSHKCKFCSKRFNTKQRKDIHEKIHTGEKPYQCNICYKRFAYRSNFSTHQRIHTGEKPYQCGVCNKFFRDQSNYNTHKRVHTDKKPFKCHICQKGLASKVSLRDHLNKHKGKKPYKCGQCAKAYTNNSSLKYHIKTHNKPFKCKYCDAAFAHKHRYNSHIRYEEESNDNLKCHHCKKVYLNKYILEQHNKRVHPRM